MFLFTIYGKFLAEIFRIACTLNNARQSESLHLLDDHRGLTCKEDFHLFDVLVCQLARHDVRSQM